MTDLAGAPRLVTREFALVGLAATLYFAGIGVTLPVLPGFVRDELGGSDTVVGIVISTLSAAAVAARPKVGALGDRHGRRLLVVGGGLCSAVGLVGHLLASSLPMLLVARLVVGVGQGAVMVGATTLAVDLAPAARRGEAASYVLVAVHIGIGGAPVLGELVATVGYGQVWLLGAAFCIASATAAGRLPARVPVRGGAPDEGPGRLLHRGALGPGAVVGLGIVGYNAFIAFLPLIGESVDVDDAGPLFLLGSGTMITVRLVGRALPDRLGPLRGGSLALSLLAVGLVGVGLHPTPLGLYTAAVVAAVGSALLLPSLVPAAVEGVPEHQRSAALGTFTMFIDLSLVAAGLAFGPIAEATSYATACLVGGATSFAALVALRVTRRPRRSCGGPGR